MLGQVIEYLQNQNIQAEPGFNSKFVRWIIACAEDGRYLDVIEIGDTTSKKNQGQEFAMCPDFTQPEMVAGGTTKAHFLVESVEVVTLFSKETSSVKIKGKHAYFVDLLRQAGAAMPELKKIADLLQDSDLLVRIRQRLEDYKAKPTDKMTFRLGNTYPVESTVWHNWWREFRASLVSGVKKAPGASRSFLTGRLVQPAVTHPNKIKGLAGVGGQPSGDVLIGFDKEAFCSYGLEQSVNAAMSEEEAATYCRAINELIRRSSGRLPGARVIYWFKERVSSEDDPLVWLENSEIPVQQFAGMAQRRVRELLEAVQTGKRPDLARNRYYALTLSGAGGRVMVRDWVEGEFKRLVANIANWFDDMSIVQRDGGGPAPPPKFYAVLGAIEEAPADLPAPLASRIWRVAVQNEPIPETVLVRALNKVRRHILKGENPNQIGLGLIKAYHLRKTRTNGERRDTMEEDLLRPELNEKHPSPAYHCGRILAILAQLQRSALGNINAGLIERYYAAASATPALVLGRLIRNSQYHLGKLEPGLAYWYEEKLARIWKELGDGVPPTLTLEGQSLFALGYYQQLADLRSKKK